MRSKIQSLAIAPILLCGLAVSGCGDPDRIQAGYPPAADVEAAQAGKPEPSTEIVTDPVAEASYNAAIESWGDTVHDAAVRTCRELKRLGAPYSFECGETSAERAARLGVE